MRISLNTTMITDRFTTAAKVLGNYCDSALNALKQINWSPREFSKHSFAFISKNSYVHYSTITMITGLLLAAIYLINRKKGVDTDPAQREQLLKELAANPKLCEARTDEMNDLNIWQNDVYLERWKGLTLAQIIEKDGPDFAANLTIPIDTSFKDLQVQFDRQIKTYDELVKLLKRVKPDNRKMTLALFTPVHISDMALVALYDHPKEALMEPIPQFLPPWEAHEAYRNFQQSYKAERENCTLKLIEINNSRAPDKEEECKKVQEFFKQFLEAKIKELRLVLEIFLDPARERLAKLQREPSSDPFQN